MSWEVLVFNFDGHPPPADVTSRFGPHPMGTDQMVRESVEGALADVAWDAPSHGRLDAGSYAMELALQGDAKKVESLKLSIRGDGDARSLIVHLCRVNGWEALDGSTGKFLPLDEPDSDDE